MKPVINEKAANGIVAIAGSTSALRYAHKDEPLVVDSSSGSLESLECQC